MKHLIPILGIVLVLVRGCTLTGQRLSTGTAGTIPVSRWGAGCTSITSKLVIIPGRGGCWS